MYNLKVWLDNECLDDKEFCLCNEMVINKFKDIQNYTFDTEEEMNKFISNIKEIIFDSIIILSKGVDMMCNLFYNLGTYVLVFEIDWGELAY